MGHQSPCRQECSLSSGPIAWPQEMGQSLNWECSGCLQVEHVGPHIIRAHAAPRIPPFGYSFVVTLIKQSNYVNPVSTLGQRQLFPAGPVQELGTDL